MFVWRLRGYPVTRTPAACIEEVSPSSFTFSALGNDAPLFRLPVAEADETVIAGEANLPLPIRRLALSAGLEACYGPDRSFLIERGVRSRGRVVRRPVPVDRLVVADLSGWTYRPRQGTVAVDPELGRIAFPPGQPPQGVWVSYRYGFSGDIGGGEYPRKLLSPGAQTFHQVVRKPEPGGQATEAAASIEEALRRWDAVRDRYPTAVVEILDSEVYSEQLDVTLNRGERLEIRAADRARPVIYLLDRQRNAPDSLTLRADRPDSDVADTVEREATESQAVETVDPQPPIPAPGGCVRLDGLLIAGRAVHVEGPLQRVEIVDCTLVPGWGLRADCSPLRPAEPSLELYLTTACVMIERSILGSIQVYQVAATADPVAINLSDSILDATSDEREAVGAPNWPLAHAAVSLHGCTVIGKVETAVIPLAENSIITGQVRVGRRQLGCIRYSYVAPGSRTPRRYRCQPDLAVEAGGIGDAVRVRPTFTSRRYGEPGYGQLRDDCADEIVTGAEDESEMGAFHDLFQPQRLANLRARLAEFSPARTDIAVLVEN